MGASARFHAIRSHPRRQDHSVRSSASIDLEPLEVSLRGELHSCGLYSSATKLTKSFEILVRCQEPVIVICQFSMHLGFAEVSQGDFLLPLVQQRSPSSLTTLRGFNGHESMW